MLRFFINNTDLYGIRKSVVNRVEAFDFLKDLVEEYPDAVMEKQQHEEETLDSSMSSSAQAPPVRKKRRRAAAASKETLTAPSSEDAVDQDKKRL